MSEIPERPPDGVAHCDRCRHDFIYWVPCGLDASDFFEHIKKAMGKVVCPSCIAKVAQQ